MGRSHLMGLHKHASGMLLAVQNAKQGRLLRLDPGGLCTCLVLVL